MKVSIRQKVFAVILIASLVPTVLLGFFSYRTANNVLSQELKNASAQSVQKVEESTKMYMQGYEQNATRLSTEASILLAAKEQKPEEALLAFKAYKESHPDVLNVYVGTSAKKMFVFPEAQLPTGFDPTSRPWYTEAVKAGKPIWTEPYLDTATKKLVISVAKPVIDPENKQVIGVVGLDISLETLSTMIQSMKIGKAGYVVLLDQAGKVMVHPDKNQIGKDLPIPELNQALKQETGVVDYNYNGDSRFGAFDTYKLTGWKFIGVLSYSEIHDETALILRQTLIFSLLFAVLAILIGLWITNGFTKALKSLVRDAELIGTGDFTVETRIKTQDEAGVLAKTLNHMTQELSQLMQNVRTLANQVTQSAELLAANAQETTASSEEVTATAVQIATGASDQAVQAEKGSTMVQNFALKFEFLEDNAKDMTQSSFNAQKANNRGMQTVEILMTNTEINQSSIEKVGQVIAALDKKTQDIGHILQAITSIAGQTNLLALNASIEAARAGEAGRGFAVVAEEIRKLAEQSAQSVSGIREIIQDIQKESKQAVDVVQDVSNHTEETVLSAHQVQESFVTISQAILEISEKIAGTTASITEMVEDSDHLVEVIQNISAVSEETAAASEEVNASMEQTSGAVEEVARTAQQLTDLSYQLNQEILRFKVK